MKSLLDMQDRLSQTCLLLGSLRDTLIMFEDNKEGCIPVTVCTVLEMSIEKSMSMIYEVSEWIEIKRTAGKL